MPRETAWPPVRFAPDFFTAVAMRAELRTYGRVLAELARALRDLEARVGRTSLLVEEQPQPELEAAVPETASRVERAARACRSRRPQPASPGRLAIARSPAPRPCPPPPAEARGRTRGPPRPSPQPARGSG
jgi:hypothetical protein